MNRQGFRAAFAVIGAIATALLIVAAIAISFGAYNIGADAPHANITHALIGFARDRSIEVRSASVFVPPLNNPGMIADGAADYDAMCTGCHLAPGIKENEMRPGMYPRPPLLASQPADDPAEQFWIVKHGIKMSGMPAWGATHSDKEIWNIVAFLQKLPSLSPPMYRALVSVHAGHHDHDDDNMNMSN